MTHNCEVYWGIFLSFLRRYSRFCVVGYRLFSRYDIHTYIYIYVFMYLYLYISIYDKSMYESIKILNFQLIRIPNIYQYVYVSMYMLMYILINSCKSEAVCVYGTRGFSHKFDKKRFKLLKQFFACQKIHVLASNLSLSLSL